MATDKKRSILIVDDEPDNIQLLANILTGEGYRIEYAINSFEAIEQIREFEFDLFLLDVNMPDINGFELCKTLKNNKKTCKTPVIFLSGLDDIENKVLGFQVGGCDYITKPFQIDEVLARVRTHLDLQNTKNELEHTIREREKLNRMLEIILKSIPETIITVDDSLRVLSLNKVFDGGLLPVKVDKLEVREVLTEDHNPYYEIVLQTLQDQNPVVEKYVEIMNSDGVEKVLILNTNPIVDQINARTGVVLVIRDITRLIQLEKSRSDRAGFFNLIGKNENMQKVYSLLESVSKSGIATLIQGESGTGKELVAEAIHFGSPRANKPLVKVNCAALSDNLLESELFGHIKGAFTGANKDRIGRFQMANGGTIFLDEIGDVTHNMQLRLLRVLEQKEFERIGESKTTRVDVRIVSATNSNLQEKVKKGEFRADLYYRLKGIVIQLPPLNVRGDDILLLANHFVNQCRVSFKKNIVGIADTVKEIFLKYSWPGNVRELKHAVEHACVLCPKGLITDEYLPQDLLDSLPAPDNRKDSKESFIYSPKITKQVLVDAMNKNRWNKAKTAGDLNIARNTLYRYLKMYGIE